MSFCYPSETDWGSKFSPDEISNMRADPLKAAAMERAEALAWQTLASLTGYQIGVCPITVRPCSAGLFSRNTWLEAPVFGPGVAIGHFAPYLVGGNWYNACGCRSASRCGCSRNVEVILPGPVGSIERIVISGEVIAPERYRVDDGTRLVAVDPELRWPVEQNVTAGPDDFGAFSVTYYQGAAPNSLTRTAAGLLAVEFYAELTGGKCALPRGIRAVARSNGTTYDVKASLFEGGFTGITIVDALIRSLNPHGLKSAPTVTSPDVDGGGRRQTWGQW